MSEITHIFQEEAKEVLVPPMTCLFCNKVLGYLIHIEDVQLHTFGRVYSCYNDKCKSGAKSIIRMADAVDSHRQATQEDYEISNTPARYKEEGDNYPSLASEPEDPEANFEIKITRFGKRYFGKKSKE